MRTTSLVLVLVAGVPAAGCVIDGSGDASTESDPTTGGDPSTGSSSGGGGQVGGSTYDAGGAVAEMVATNTHLFTISGFDVRRIELATGESVVLSTVEDGFPTKLALEGSELIWMETIGDEGSVIRKIPSDAAPGTASELLVSDGYSTTFAVSETTVYYPLEFAIRSVPIAGGAATDVYTADDGPGTGFHMGGFDFDRTNRMLVYYEGTGIFSLDEAGGAPQARILEAHPDGGIYGLVEVPFAGSVAWMECEDPSQGLRFFESTYLAPSAPKNRVAWVPQINPFIQCPWMTTTFGTNPDEITAYFVVNQDDGMGGDEWKAYAGSFDFGTSSSAEPREFGPADAFSLGPVATNDDYVFLAAEVGVEHLIYAYPRPI